MIEFVGLNAINGPLIVLDGVPKAGYEEQVSLRMANGETRMGRIVQMEGERAVIQVFEGTRGMALDNTRVTFQGHPMEMPLAMELLGRSFNGSGRPIDGMGEIFAETSADINGLPMNPVARVYPRNYINTGISTIDGLATLIRGQKRPFFSGVKNDVADYFRRSFEEAGVMDKVVMFLNLSDDPIIERILAPRCALTTAEYFAFQQGLHVLVIMTDITAYCEALREFSSSKGEIPGRKGFPGYLYSDLASLYERAGIIEGSSGSVTQVPILTMPNDDITHPVPDLTGYITEGQIVLERELDQKGIYPPISVLPSLSRLMKDGIGEGFTRSDHSACSNQLFAAYARVQDARALASVIGEEELAPADKKYILFGRLFEEHFVNQGNLENRTIEQTLNLGWQLLSLLPKEELDRCDAKTLEQFYQPEEARKTFGVSAED